MGRNSYDTEYSHQVGEAYMANKKHPTEEYDLPFVL